MYAWHEGGRRKIHHHHPQLDYKPYGSNHSLMMAKLQEPQKSPLEIGGPCGGVPLDLWTKGQYISFIWTQRSWSHFGPQNSTPPWLDQHNLLLYRLYPSIHDDIVLILSCYITYRSPSSEPKSKTQSASLRCKGTNYVSVWYDSNFYFIFFRPYILML